jgi:hexosaminidase
VLWRDNDAHLQPLLGRSDITQELIPVSTSVKKTAEIGLRALDLLQQSQTSPAASAKDSDLAFLEEAKKPQAVLLQMVAPGVELLVKAEKVAGQSPSQ